MLDDVATQQNGVKDCPELSDIFVNAISNTTIVGNTFEVSTTASIDDVFQTGPPCCKVQGGFQHDNRLVRTATDATATASVDDAK